MLSGARVRQTAEMEAAFSVANVSFSVDQRELLHGVSLDFAAGEISALVGHNGSGKSTLLKLLARQILPSSGQIRVGDTLLSAFDQRAFARSVAYLPQELSVAAGMTVRELVSSGRYPWHGALGRFTANDHDKVEEALALTHIEGLAHRHPLRHVENHHVAELFEADQMSKRAADHAAADQRDLGPRHRGSSPCHWG